MCGLTQVNHFNRLARVSLTQEDGMCIPRRRWHALIWMAVVLAALSVVAAYHETTLKAFSYVIDVNGTYWEMQDDDSPRVDTGSIRATQVAPGGNTERTAPRSTASVASRCSSRQRRHRISTANLHEALA